MYTSLFAVKYLRLCIVDHRIGGGGGGGVVQVFFTTYMPGLVMAATLFFLHLLAFLHPTKDAAQVPWFLPATW